MSLSKEAIKELKQKKLVEVVVEFMPNPTFEEEFLEFVESVINWPRSEKEKFKEVCQQKSKYRKI